MVDAMKIAKLRAKAMSTSYEQEAAMFERKASQLQAEHGIADADIERALAEIFGERPAQPTPPWSASWSEPSPSPPRESDAWAQDDEPLELATITEAIIFVLEGVDRPMRAREIWTAIEDTSLYRSDGKTPWATVGSKLSTQTDLFERVAPGLYRLREAA